MAAQRVICAMSILTFDRCDEIYLFISLLIRIFSYSPTQMDLITGMPLETSPRQTVPMVMAIFILHRSLVKLLHHQHPIICNPFTDLWVTRHRPATTGAMLTPIIKSSSRKIWFTGRESRQLREGRSFRTDRLRAFEKTNASESKSTRISWRVCVCIDNWRRSALISEQVKK